MLLLLALWDRCIVIRRQLNYSIHHASTAVVCEQRLATYHWDIKMILSLIFATSARNFLLVPPKLLLDRWYGCLNERPWLLKRGCRLSTIENLLRSFDFLALLCTKLFWASIGLQERHWIILSQKLCCRTWLFLLWYTIATILLMCFNPFLRRCHIADASVEPIVTTDILPLVHRINFMRRCNSDKLLLLCMLWHFYFLLRFLLGLRLETFKQGGGLWNKV